MPLVAQADRLRNRNMCSLVYVHEPVCVFAWEGQTDRDRDEEEVSKQIHTI